MVDSVVGLGQVFLAASEEQAATLRSFGYLIPIIPMIAFALILGFGKRMPGRGAWLGIGASALNLLFALKVLLETIAVHGEPLEKSVTWFNFRDTTASSGGFLELGMRIDGLAAIMFVVVTLISLLVQIYSSEYMEHEPRYTWYFAVINLFTGSMLTLVIANNTVLLLVGWELVGVCSYFLIGHFFEEKANSSAAIKAFITTRVGDLGFAVGVFALFIGAGTFNIAETTERVLDGSVTEGFVVAGALLLFCGAVGKSAQFPLHVWLPDAMAGPTPASALIHAATMVTAGVYMLARLFQIFASSATVMTVVAVIAMITMLGSALMATVQRDIKRVLAYSTVSQLAYMMAAISVGAAGAGIFHLFTHAFFKALLFLCAGSVIHAVHTNDMFEMGGLRKYLPTTSATFLVGSLALAGIPPLAGFWSKDEIVAAAFESNQAFTIDGLHMWVFGIGLVTAFLTAFYMSRTYVLTFLGTWRRAPAGNQGHTHADTAHADGHAHEGHHLPHEPGRAMRYPLIVLAVLSVVGGWVGIPFEKLNFFADWVHIEGTHHGEFVAWIAALSVLLAVGGIALGYKMYAHSAFGFSVKDPLERLGPVHRLLTNRFYIDDFYMRVFIRPVQYAMAKAVYRFDQRIINATVNGAAIGTVLLGRATRTIDEEGVDGAVNGFAKLFDGLGGLLKKVQSGNVQRYAAGLFGGLVILAAVLFVNS